MIDRPAAVESITYPTGRGAPRHTVGRGPVFLARVGRSSDHDSAIDWPDFIGRPGLGHVPQADRRSSLL